MEEGGDGGERGCASWNAEGFTRESSKRWMVRDVSRGQTLLRNTTPELHSAIRFMFILTALIDPDLRGFSFVKANKSRALEEILSKPSRRMSYLVR